MNPVVFGRRDRRLSGLHLPARGTRRRRGVVLCPPFGQEALRAHRSLRLLGDQLAAAGVDVLRFDLYGTGDSAGDDTAGSPDGWVEDVRTAATELRDLAGVRLVTLVGLRLGALLAAEAAEGHEVVLWDPVVDGRAYVDELLSAARPAHDGGPAQVRGLPLTARMMAELESRDLASTLESLSRPPRAVRVVVSRPDPLLDDARPRMEAKIPRMEMERLDAPAAWTEDSDFGAGAVPVDVLRRIVEWAA